MAKGDVELTATDYGPFDGAAETKVDNVQFGIDADTVVFYYHKDGSSARIGYDEMARLVEDGTAVTVVAKKGDTDVAAAILLYPSTAVKFGTDNYVYVLREYNKVGSEYRFNVVDKEGNVTEVKAKSGQDDVAKKLNALNVENAKMDCNREGLLYIMNMNGEYAEFDEPDAYNTGDHTVVYGVVRFEKDSTRYVRIYTDYEVVGADKDTVEINEAGPSLRLPVRSLDNVFDVDTLRVTDDKAVTTKLDNGMLVAIAYDKDSNNRTIIGAYVEEFYKMDVDDSDAPAPIVEGVYADISTNSAVKVYYTGDTAPTDEEALAEIEKALEADNSVVKIKDRQVDSNGYYVFTVETKSGFDKKFTFNPAAANKIPVYSGKLNNVDVLVPTGNGAKVSTAIKVSDFQPVSLNGNYVKVPGAAGAPATYPAKANAAVADHGFELEDGYYKVTLTVTGTPLTDNTGVTITSTINGAASPAYVKDTKSVTINLVTAGAKMGATHKVQGAIATDVAGNPITVPTVPGTPADYFAAESEIGTAKEITVTLTDNIGADTELTVTLTEATA